MPEYEACAYCRKSRGATTDHLITKNQARRMPRAQANREEPRFKVKACSACNIAKYTLLRVPVGYPHKSELEEITGCTYGWYDGTPESLREVLAR